MGYHPSSPLWPVKGPMMVVLVLLLILHHHRPTLLYNRIIIHRISNHRMLRLPCLRWNWECGPPLMHWTND